MDEITIQSGQKTIEQNHWKSETIALLGICSLRGVGYWTLWNLALTGLGFKQILKLPSAQFKHVLKHAGYKGGFPPSISEDYQLHIWEQGKRLNHYLANAGIQVIHKGSPDFPDSLSTISDPPKWLFVKGNPSVLHQKSIAIVGTRKPTDDGNYLAKHICGCLWKVGTICTISGLATGIDQLVHAESLRYHIPTIAVLGTGILSDYPAGTDSVKNNICSKGGAIITEYPPDQSYSKEGFVRRNRIQAGLSSVVLPVEWNVKSGTAHTFRYALKAGKTIICFRMPDWDDAHSEIKLARESGVDIITLPGEEELFITKIKAALSSNDLNSGSQLELWN